MTELERSADTPGWSFTDKWPAESGLGGYTMVPNTLLKHYRKLELTPGEFLILINIESYRWSVERLPFPSIKELSKRTGMSERTITRTISSLQNQRGVLERYKYRGSSNRYSIEPLVEKLIGFEEEEEVRYWQN